MEKYYIQKEVRREALIIGLKMRAFYLFFAVFLCSVFVLLNAFSLFRFLVVLGLDAGIYAVLLFLQNLDFEQYFSALPKTLINK